jgi:dienelactone hydrolase
MSKIFRLTTRIRRTAAWTLGALLAIVLLAEVVGYAVMTNGFTISVSNIWIKNKNGLMVRGKLYRPENATTKSPAPGIVYLHGYQNNRETSDPYGIELSRRGFVVILLDTLGRGNSDNQFSEEEPGFDPTYGGESAFAALQNLPYVDPERCGLAGHSLGGEMIYAAALTNPAVQAIVFSGFAYTETATPDTPKNMLMIFGKYDEYRDRMTGTRDFEVEWMSSPQTRAAIAASNPQFDTTYGSFSEGTARRVHMTPTTHVSESFNVGAIAEAIHWFQQALKPGQTLTIPASRQIWRVKEIASLIAMLSGIFSTIPAGILLLGIRPFSELVREPCSDYSCNKQTFWKAFWINGGLILSYLGLVMVIFGLHVYVVPIDGVFPMMMVNGVVFWFLITNVIGFFILRRWVRKTQPENPSVNFMALGVSEEKDRIRISWSRLWRALLLALILFAFVYLLEAGLEALFLMDFRYKFPYASDLTPFRGLMMLLYFPLFLIGFLQVNILLQGQLRPGGQKSPWRTAWKKSLTGILVMAVPLLLHMALQYVPLFINGWVPFVGPGGALVGFVINLEHMLLIQVMMIPIASVLFEVTGDITTGAILNALIVTWMFTSSSVIAPLPV